MIVTNTTKTEEAPSYISESSFTNKGTTYPPIEAYRLASGLTSLYEVYTPNSTGSRKHWKSFSHYKREAFRGEATGITVYSNIRTSPNGDFAQCQLDDGDCLGSWSFGPPGISNYGLPVMYDPGLTGSFIPAPADINSLTSVAINAMMPTIRPDLSIVNSLIELKDFKSLPHMLKNWRLIAQRSLPLPQKRVAKLLHGKVTVAELVREAANAYLQKKFNIDPLISDVRAVVNALQRAERRLNDLITRSGRKRVCHWQCKLNEDQQLRFDKSSVVSYFDKPVFRKKETGSVFGLSCLTHLERTTTTRPAEFHAELEYNYNYFKYQVEHARILGLLDVLGVNNPLHIVWNAIPWSFVVDWVVGVSRWLDQTQRVGWMDPAINIHQFCWSIKRERIIHTEAVAAFWKNSYETGSGTPVRTTLPVVRETAYRRDTPPLTLSSLTASGLSSQELTLGAALVISRRRKRKRIVI